jgi:hypothetical protein
MMEVRQIVEIKQLADDNRAEFVFGVVLPDEYVLCYQIQASEKQKLI